MESLLIFLSIVVAYFIFSIFDWAIIGWILRYFRKK